ncbi:TetR family transcriptional regulator [Duganella sp. FT80W]|uniref:TetR family transcriptional regulator n=1 Tax=Duganella guangzhouensis TaxID=2666084 RepID=A0A6I2L8F4_9BURK|nr:TetR/AcrR family transcriptional regulator [Duganella guangzhouensis]MRW93487.1 TetR family transcriptional regulator [Duganella guangzhouensis]
MSEEQAAAGAGARKLRTDGAQARERILFAALKLFVAKGYHTTSVRDIAAEAGVNSAAIRYYFGDKASLYRAALYEPVQEYLLHETEPFDAPGLPIEEALRRFTIRRMVPLSGGEAIRLSVRLRMRESFEPTGLLEDERYKAEQEQRLLDVLARVLQVPHSDPELIALGIAIRALTASLIIGREHLCKSDPLFDTPAGLDAWIARLTRYACAMVAVEQARRHA